MNRTKNRTGNRFQEVPKSAVIKLLENIVTTLVLVPYIYVLVFSIT